MSDAPLYMDKRGGYTRDPRAALAGVPADDDDAVARGTEVARQFAELEPEAVPPTEVASLPSSTASRERFDAERSVELAYRDAKRRSTRLRNYQNEAIRGGLDVDRMLKSIDRQLDLLGRTLAQSRAA